MNKQSGFLSKILIALAMLIFLASTFCFFGPAITIGDAFREAASPSMFAFMVDMVNDAGVYRINSMTTLFVFQMIIVCLILIIIAGMLMKRNIPILTIIFVAIICLSSVIATILAFNAKNFCSACYGSAALDMNLGAGAISYAVLNLVGLGCCATGAFLSRRGA